MGGHVGNRLFEFFRRLKSFPIGPVDAVTSASCFTQVAPHAKKSAIGPLKVGFV
jgi:hypothetical protein